jgi:MoxR-like ATPase
MPFAVDGPLQLHQALSRVVLGKEEPLARLVLAAVAGGHLLVEDVPGVGKTTAAKALARLTGADFKRVQFTPDLLPYDLTGVDVFHPETRAFEFRPGPVFTQVVLADEINRATPKVQSALLEVMEEGQVTVGGVTRPVDEFFLVVATQNPLDLDGTFPLPAAQLDRFFLKLSFGYPDAAAEEAVWLNDPGHAAPEAGPPPVTTAELMALRARVPSVYVAPELLHLARRVVDATRHDPAVALGLSPRAGVHLVKALRTWALLHGRDYCVSQDFQDLALDVWAHRLELKDAAQHPRDYLKGLVDAAMVNHEGSRREG